MNWFVLLYKSFGDFLMTQPINLNTKTTGVNKNRCRIIVRFGGLDMQIESKYAAYISPNPIKR
jgi:hypothetical protein